MEQNNSIKPDLLLIKNIKEYPDTISILCQISQELENLFAIYMYFYKKKYHKSDAKVGNLVFIITLNIKSESIRNIELDVTYLHATINEKKYINKFQFAREIMTEANVPDFLEKIILSKLLDENLELSNDYIALVNSIRRKIITLAQKSTVVKKDLQVQIIADVALPIMTEDINVKFIELSNYLKFVLLYYDFGKFESWMDLKNLPYGALIRLDIGLLSNLLLRFTNMCLIEKQFQNHKVHSLTIMPDIFMKFDFYAHSNPPLSKYFDFSSSPVQNVNNGSIIYGDKDYYSGFSIYADVGARVYYGNSNILNTTTVHADFGSLYQIMNPHAQKIGEFQFKLEKVTFHKAELYAKACKELYTKIFVCYPAHPLILINSYFLYKNYILMKSGNTFALADLLVTDNLDFELNKIINSMPEFVTDHDDYNKLVDLSKNIESFAKYYGLDLEYLFYYNDHFQNDLYLPYYALTRNALAILIDYLIANKYMLLIEIFVETYLYRSVFNIPEKDRIEKLKSELNYLSTPIVIPEISNYQDYLIYFPTEVFDFSQYDETFTEKVFLTKGFYIIIYDNPNSDYSYLAKSNETIFLDEEFKEYKNLFLKYGIDIIRVKSKSNDIQKQFEVLKLGIPFEQLKPIFDSEGLGIYLWNISNKHWQLLRKQGLRQGLIGGV